MYSGIPNQKPKFNIYAGLMPCSDMIISDNKPQKRDEFKTSEQMEPTFNNHKMANETFIKPGQIEEAKEAPAIVDKIKASAKRKGSIDGTTIKELTLNIIKDKPGLPKIIKAFNKMAEISQTQKDNEIFDFE